MKKGSLEHIKLKENKFKIPEGYFNSVEDAVFAKLITEKLPNKSGYKTTDGYFNKVEDTVLTELKGGNRSEETGYKAPDSYFETLEDAVFNKIKNEDSPVKVIDFRTFIIKRVLPIAAAASLALFIYVNYSSSTLSIEDVASSDVQQWIDNDLLIFDSYEVAEVYNDIELEDENVLNATDEELLEYIDGTEIESLLLENLSE